MLNPDFHYREQCQVNNRKKEIVSLYAKDKSGKRNKKGMDVSDLSDAVTCTPRAIHVHFRYYKKIVDLPVLCFWMSRVEKSLLAQNRMPRHRGVQSDTDSLKNNNKNKEEKAIVSYSSSIHAFDVNMKARSKGHIATKLYKMAEARPTTMTKT